MTGQPQLTCPPVGAFEVDLQPLALPGGTIVTAAAPFSVTSIYSTGGAFASFLTGISVSLNFEVKYESIGAGPEGSLGILVFNLNAGFTQPTVVCVPPHPMVFDYNLSLPVLPGTLPAGHIFKLAGMVYAPGFPVFAFDENSILINTI